MNEEWGPLAGLIGEWEGHEGLDVAYSHERGEVIDTAYVEKMTMKPFGPVHNGRQSVFGLDYRTAMWRGSEDAPFHTEVGYWLWDAASGEVMRAFVVPRGIALMAGGTTTADASEFTMRADRGDEHYTIAENRYLAKNASTLSFESTIRIIDGDTWSYAETTMLRMNEIEGLFAHTDRSVLRRVG